MTEPARSKGRVVVTCGPSYEPIDEVRRITNHSTGKLGIELSNLLAARGWSVVCLKGVGATHPVPLSPGVQRLPFSTNDHLLERLAALSKDGDVVAVFQAAALCDFKPRHVTDASGADVGSAKLSSRIGELTIVLEPATKLIGHMRGLFPRAALVGWKYELVGSREDVIAKGKRQLDENKTDLCVLNGSAYGPGFGVLDLRGALTHVAGYDALCEWLAAWLERSLSRM